jgi:hypothetical protein
VAAKPLLVVARAWNPSQASSRADPWSQGLGRSSGRPGTCSSRNRLALPAWSVMTGLQVTGPGDDRASVGNKMRIGMTPDNPPRHADLERT